MLETEACMKHFFENMIELKPNTIPNKYKEGKSCWLREQEIKIEDEQENPVVKDHCHLGKFRGLAHE